MRNPIIDITNIQSGLLEGMGMRGAKVLRETKMRGLEKVRRRASWLAR